MSQKEVLLTEDQKAFHDAMERYEAQSGYQFWSKGVSVINITLQLLLCYLILPVSITPIMFLFSLITAYLLTDFINGIAHMVMDNYGRYDSIVGPLVASFHLHHKNPRYKPNKLWKLYFNETGSKVWLVPFLMLFVWLIQSVQFSPFWLYTLLMFSILSSFAELSHYLCHNSNHPLVHLFSKMRLLLPKRHHAKHHLEDNKNYAFLNGVTDPLLNLIAKLFYSGYKEGTDKHFEHYIGAGTSNRE